MTDLMWLFFIGFLVCGSFVYQAVVNYQHGMEKSRLLKQIEDLTAAVVARNTSEYYSLRDQSMQQEKDQPDVQEEEVLPDLIPIESMDDDDFSLMYETRHQSN